MGATIHTIQNCRNCRIAAHPCYTIPIPGPLGPDMVALGGSRGGGVCLGGKGNPVAVYRQDVATGTLITGTLITGPD